jgi:hypothetical protein
VAGAIEFFLNTLVMNLVTTSLYGVLIQMPTIEFITGNQLPMSSTKYNVNIIIVSSISFAIIFTAIIEAKMVMKDRIAPSG